jgi:hypothetical protein
MSNLSAYQDLMTALASRRPGQSAAEDERVVLGALEKHTRELAERIRELSRDGYSAQEIASQLERDAPAA